MPATAPLKSLRPVRKALAHGPSAGGARAQSGYPSISRMPAVQKRTGLSKASIYKLKAEGKFPQSISLSARSIGFLDSEITAWIEERVRRTRTEEYVPSSKMPQAVRERYRPDSAASDAPPPAALPEFNSQK
jgi:prophage regulatory protein